MLKIPSKNIVAYEKTVLTWPKLILHSPDCICDEDADILLLLWILCFFVFLIFLLLLFIPFSH